MIVEVTAQLFDGADVMWAYHHKEVVIPVVGPDAGEDAVTRARKKAADKLLAHIDAARVSVSDQVASTDALFEGEEEG